MSNDYLNGYRSALKTSIQILGDAQEKTFTTDETKALVKVATDELRKLIASLHEAAGYAKPDPIVITENDILF